MGAEAHQKHFTFFVHKSEAESPFWVQTGAAVVAQVFLGWIKSVQLCAPELNALSESTSWVLSLAHTVRTSSPVYAGNNNRAPLSLSELLETPHHYGLLMASSVKYKAVF